MFKVFLESQGISHDRYEIVPFPINFPEKIANYVPSDAAYLLTIYDDWGRKKKAELEALGYTVEVTKEMTLDARSKSGTEIRTMIAQGNDTWREFVPESVQAYLTDSGAIKKIV